MPYRCNPFCFTRYLYHTTYSGERKEDLKKTTKSIFFLIASPERRRWAAKPLGGFFLCLAGLYKSTFQNFFTWHTAQERPPKKVRTIFVPLFPKVHRRSLIFAQTGTFPAAISEKGYKSKRNLIFFCAVCQVFFVCFTFSAPPPQSACKKIRAFCLHEIFRCAIMLFGNTEPPVPCAR